LNKKKLFSILSSTAILLSLYSAPTASANSQSLNELEQQKQELNKQSDELRGNINDAEEEMQSLDSEREQLTQDITEIQSNIDKVIAQIKEQEEEIARLEEEIEQLNNEIEILKDKIEKRNAALAEQAREVQTTASPNNIIDIVLSAESLSDLVGKMEVINLLVDNNNNIMEDQISDRKQVEEKAEEVEVAKDETNQVKQELDVSRNNLVAQRMELDSKVQIVSEEYDLTNAERETLLGEQQAIAEKTSGIEKQVEEEQARIAAEEKARQEREAEARRIAEAEAEEARKAEEAAQAEKAKEEKQVQTASSSKASAPSKSETSSTPSAPSKPSTPAPAPSTGSSENSGGWARPASGPVTSEFGYRVHPIQGTRKLHAGIDIGGGGPITAAKSGTVVSASFHGSLGYNVLIDHGGGIRTRYGHMTPALQVAPGQSVSQGQQIGTMGTTGSSTGVHLHFEVHVNGSPVNPRNYVSF
jgi:murein DD-endopeptidase MepM/ murein hydrolase activator NlpD